MSQEQRTQRLEGAMRELARQVGERRLPPGLEQKLVGEFVRVKTQRRRRTWMAIASIAAAAVLAVWMNLPRTVEQAASPVPSQLAVQAMAQEAAGAVEEPFVPIPYVSSPGPFERVEVVRMEMPVAALIAAGIPVGSVDAGAQVQADVVVGQDGRAHAVRLVSAGTVRF